MKTTISIIIIIIQLLCFFITSEQTAYGFWCDDYIARIAWLEDDADVKDKQIKKLENEKNSLQEQLETTESHMQEQLDTLPTHFEKI